MQFVDFAKKARTAAVRRVYENKEKIFGDLAIKKKEDVEKLLQSDNFTFPFVSLLSSSLTRVLTSLAFSRIGPA